MPEANRPRKDDAAAVSAEFAARMLRVSISFSIFLIGFIFLFVVSFIQSFFHSIINPQVNAPRAEANDDCLRNAGSPGKSFVQGC